MHASLQVMHRRLESSNVSGAKYNIIQTMTTSKRVKLLSGNINKGFNNNVHCAIKKTRTYLIVALNKALPRK